jgi:hypothetical protein
MPGQKSVFCDIVPASNAWWDRRDMLIDGFRQQSSAGWSIDTAYLGLDRFAQVLQQMESVSHLPRLRCAGSRALRVKATAIATDDFYLRAPTEPFGYPDSPTVLQQIDNLASLQIDDDGPICVALSATPVVYACHPYRRHPPAGDLPLQVPKDGVVADGDKPPLGLREQ